jgi:hypothetical protein
MLTIAYPGRKKQSAMLAAKRTNSTNVIDCQSVYNKGCSDGKKLEIPTTNIEAAYPTTNIESKPAPLMFEFGLPLSSGSWDLSPNLK